MVNKLILVGRHNAFLAKKRGIHKLVRPYVHTQKIAPVKYMQKNMSQKIQAKNEGGGEERRRERGPTKNSQATCY